VNDTSKEHTPSIFVSYRVADTLQTADRLAAELQRKFGADEVFFDHRTMDPGDRWDSRIEAAVSGAAIVLVLIGEKWLTEQDQYGVRRLDVSSDWVRREVETALTKAGRVIPVLVDGASPTPKEAFDRLPSLVPLSSCQVARLRTREWDTDFGDLVGLLISKGLALAAEADVSQTRIVLHVLQAKFQVPHWSEAAEVKFSLTNLGRSPVKLTRLELRVLERTPIQDVAFRKAGAPLPNFQLEATIGADDYVDLLQGLKTQFVLAPGSSDAFSLALRGPEGFLVDCRLHVRVDDLATTHEFTVESDTLQVEYPIRSLRVLQERTTRR